MTSILAADSQLRCDTVEIHSDDTSEDDDIDHEYSPCLDANISGEPLRSDVTITSPEDSDELHQVPEATDSDAGMMQCIEAGLDSVTSSGGQNHQTFDICDRSEDCRPADVSGSSGVDKKIRCKDVQNGARSSRGQKSATDKDKPGRICDDCRAGSTRRTAAISRDGTQRWNSPASQQSSAVGNRTAARSIARPSEGSIGDQSGRRSRLNKSTEGTRRRITATSQNTINNSQRRAAANNDKQSRCRDNRASRSPTSLKNRSGADSAASGRGDVTSGHVTRRSHSAKMASSTTEVTGRRCKSSDDRRQRRKNSPAAADRELTQAPFHRKCCCATRNVQGEGHQMTSEGQSGSRTSERRALPDAVSRPWARTLRDYGEKSPSPVRSRRSTPESSNCARTWTRSTRTGSEVISGQDSAVNCRPLPSSRAKRPTPADLGTTKSDSTLVRNRAGKKTGSSGSSTIPPSTSLGTVTQRRTLSHTARSVAKQTPRERKTTTAPPTRQQVDKTTTRSPADTSGRAPYTPSRRKTTVLAAQTDPKQPNSSPVPSNYKAVKAADLCQHSGPENSPSRAPAATFVKPEVFQTTRARQRLRLVENDDVSNMAASSTTKKPVTKKRSGVSNSGAVNDAVGSLSVVDQCLKEQDVRKAKLYYGHVTSMTSSTADRDLDLGQCDTVQSICGGKDKKFTSDDGSTVPPCCLQQPLEHSEIASITNDTSDGSFQQASVGNTDTRESIRLLSNTASFQHSRFITVTSSVSEDIVSSEILAEIQEIIKDEKSSNHPEDDTSASDNISIAQALLLSCSKSTKCVGLNKETEKDNNNTLSPFDELEIERDFEYMDEILSCTTPELYRFIKSPEYHFSDDPRTRFSSMPADSFSAHLNTCGQESLPNEISLSQHDDRQQLYSASEISGESSGEVGCPRSGHISTTEVRPVRRALVYSVHSVMSAPVIEVARSLNQDYCLSSPQLTDYVGENCHKVSETAAEHHQQQHLAGPGRCHEDLVDFSPCSDDIVLGSSDSSTKCSLSSPSGSQLSQDSCRWRSPDDSTLVGDSELCSKKTRPSTPVAETRLQCGTTTSGSHSRRSSEIWNNETLQPVTSPCTSPLSTSTCHRTTVTQLRSLSAVRELPV